MINCNVIQICDWYHINNNIFCNALLLVAIDRPKLVTFLRCSFWVEIINHAFSIVRLANHESIEYLYTDLNYGVHAIDTLWCGKSGTSCPVAICMQ